MAGRFKRLMAVALVSSMMPAAPPVLAQDQAAQAPAATAQQVVAAAVAALGGAEKLAAIRTITAHGYAQYAYMWGGGRIDGSDHAPGKYLAANDLTRTYDLENDRFRMRERRNMLFPFLAQFGHSFALNDMRLDGAVAFDMQGDNAVRQAVRTEGALLNDGVHMRRMWMLNNPAVLLRRMQAAGTRLSAPYMDGDNTVIEITLAEGDRLSAGFAPDGKPAFVRWGNWHANLGQVQFTTWFSGWVAWDGQGGLLLPLGYETRLDWRNIDYFKMYVDAYTVNTPIEGLAAPAAVRDAPVPPDNATRPLTHVAIGRGLWRLSTGTTVVEFADHLVLFELGVNPDAARSVLAYARNLAPGKPIRYLVASHNHFDHAAGVRQAVAEGITIIQRPSTLQQLREMAERPAPDYPDDLARNPQPFRSITMDEHLRLQDATRTLDLYWGRNNGHMADVVFGYVPEARLMMEGDMVSAAYQWAHWPDAFRDTIAHYGLEVDVVSPAHTMAEVSPDVMTHAQVEELLSGGVARARQHCAQRLEQGIYWPGCPIQSKYY
ncbi:MBL fold metallo-hydrolase [Alteraurantiacibacter buctensis]|uniref:MBL fold metallo-hydrolase n=1 Tax=Alteraurantiacibacter buctensis TaxID=1503981 RepID=A0A844Z0B3_9SPHN|nr:MBL fold metallo-hydrolase [Alteraurantiacibacter buctensis]MXO73249.1 MBL fold metallo-hydrolase [Alteraurantiacibacter buctensis]